jgi:hypothetical protein
MNFAVVPLGVYLLLHMHHPMGQLMGATQTPVRPGFLRLLTRLPRVATIGSSAGVGSSDQVPLNSWSRPTKGGRLGSWFSQ